MLWRDVKLYLRALGKHSVSLATGAAVSLVLLVWEYVLKKGDIPTWVLGLAAVMGVLAAGFLAWRDEHAKVTASREAVDPEIELRRPQFDKEIAKLSPRQEAVLRYVVRVGDSDAIQLRERFFREQGESVSPHDADLLLTDIAEATGLLEVKSKGNVYGRYAIKPVWGKLLVEWAAPPTAMDRRIADKSRQLRRQLLASFEDWPNGLNELDELTTWAGRLATGFRVAEPALREIVDLRADASRAVQEAVGTARDEYEAAADVINRLFKGGGLSIQWDERPAVEAKLRAAADRVRACIAALRTAGAGQ